MRFLSVLRTTRWKKLGPAIAGTLLLLSCTVWNRGHDPLPGFPALVLWVWEEPQDLRFLRPESAGVAYLAETLLVENGSRIVLRPRLQPLLVARSAKVMAVVRVENQRGLPFDPHTMADLVLRAPVLDGAAALQIDYDVVQSQRSTYAEFLHEVRHRLPPALPLTMTALVSWCTNDRWIDSLPVAEAVPMYFRMGLEQGWREMPTRSRMCGDSTGLSIDELVRVPLHRRLFLFSPRSWTPDSFHQAVYEVHRWS